MWCLDKVHRSYLKPDREYLIQVFSLPCDFLFWSLKGFTRSNNTVWSWKLKRSNILLQKNTAFKLNANQNATSEIIYPFHYNSRSGPPEVLYRKGVLEITSKFTRAAKQLYWNHTLTVLPCKFAVYFQNTFS